MPTEEKSGHISISDILPIIKQGFGGVGFFFGAGTSIEAGYPGLTKLTTNVFEIIDPSDKSLVQDVLHKCHLSLPNTQGNPNIEEISDAIQDYSLKLDDGNDKTNADRSSAILRSAIVKVLDSITKPNLAAYVSFFEAIKHRFDGRYQTIWIITTNYDRCLEIAASLAGVNLIDGFLGTSLRYFSPESFSYNLTTPDKVNIKHGSLRKAPTVKIIKLHGSLDWYSNDHSAYATADSSCLTQKTLRSLVLPRRNKRSETLEYPYSDLFSVAESILGTECQYLITCGYRFADDHINKRLLIPKLKNGRLKICALLHDIDTKPEVFEKYKNFNVLSPERSIINGQEDARVSESWKFSEFIKEIKNYTG